MATIRQDILAYESATSPDKHTIARIESGAGRYLRNGLSTHRIVYTDDSTADSLWITTDPANGPLKVGDVIEPDPDQPGSIRAGDYQ